MSRLATKTTSDFPFHCSSLCEFSQPRPLSQWFSCCVISPAYSQPPFRISHKMHIFVRSISSWQYVFLLVSMSIVSSSPADPLWCTSNFNTCPITSSLGAFLDQSKYRASQEAYPTRTESELRMSVANVLTSSPSYDPVKCSLSNFKNCTITNVLGVFPDLSICRASQVVYPTTESELIMTVANASMKNKKMKVVTHSSHSNPKLVCPDGEDGLLICTRYLNRIIKINKKAMTMTMESGMTLKEVIEHAAMAGLALPHSPNWSGVTIGGLISTGTHGSSLWGKGGAVHEYVVGLRIISPGGPREGYAKVWSLDTSNPDMDAAKVSLGVLGVISQVTLTLEPNFKRSITFLNQNDSEFSNQAMSFGNQHEFGDLTWYPSQRRVLHRIDDRVSNNVSGNGYYDGFAPILSSAIAAARALEDIQELMSNADAKCTAAKLHLSALMDNGFKFLNDEVSFSGFPVVGFQNHLQSSGTCLDSHEDNLDTVCPWDSRVKGFFIHQTTVSIAISDVTNFIEDVQKLRDLAPEAFCGLELYGGILFRYVKASTGYLGKPKDSVEFDMTYYRSRDPMSPRLYEDIFEEVEQIALFKYGGLPHWGKNRNIAFVGAIKKYSKAEAFLTVKNKYDPKGLFSSEWTDQILGLGGDVTVIRKGCALEGLCICSDDIHCAPYKGYVCRPGRVYRDAKVCTKLS